MTQQLATFAGGCFWCTEAIFKRIKGVTSIIPGYCGGSNPHANYKSIHDANTGEAEAIQLTFDSEIISYKELLEIFFQTHDPTTVNKQGNDVGAQYRSVIFYHDENQLNEAQEYINELTTNKKFVEPVVTQLEKYNIFIEAESYHQNYFDQNKDQPYCKFVIHPKIEKLENSFADKLK